MAGIKQKWFNLHWKSANDICYAHSKAMGTSVCPRSSAWWLTGQLEHSKSILFWLHHTDSLTLCMSNRFTVIWYSPTHFVFLSGKRRIYIWNEDSTWWMVTQIYIPSRKINIQKTIFFLDRYISREMLVLSQT